MSLGIIFALVAMLAWGFGDYFIQRSTRRFGDVETLFLITLFGSVVLLPFVWNKIPTIFAEGKSLMILLVAGVILLVAALLEFESLKRGKISVVEPTWSLEIPTAGLLAFLVLGEGLSSYQTALIVSLIFGLFLTSFQGKAFTKSFLLEKGVAISVVAALVMGSANFFVGWGARESDPLVVNFAISFVSFVGASIYLLSKQRMSETFSNIRKYPKTILKMVTLDNVAWVAFAYGMTLAPIGIAVALSESYILIAVILGFAWNKERLERHQYLGLMLAVVAAIALATVAS